MRTPWLPVVDWTDAPADLNGLVRFAERRNPGFCACAITFQLAIKRRFKFVVESSWNVMAHGDARKGIEGETVEWSG